MNCKNCGHKLYFHNGIDKWNHYTRAYRPYGYPYASTKCFAPTEDKKHCGCEQPEPQTSEGSPQ